MGSVAGFFGFLGVLVLTTLVLWVIASLFRLLQKSLRIDEQSFAYHQKLLWLGCVALSIATAAALLVLTS
jgi:hypothetical protein